MIGYKVKKKKSIERREVTCDDFFIAVDAVKTEFVFQSKRRSRARNFLRHEISLHTIGLHLFFGSRELCNLKFEENKKLLSRRGLEQKISYGRGFEKLFWYVKYSFWIFYFLLWDLFCGEKCNFFFYGWEMKCWFRTFWFSESKLKFKI